MKYKKTIEVENGAPVYSRMIANTLNKRNMTQADLASKCPNVSEATLTAWIHGDKNGRRTEPKVGGIVEVAKALDVSTDYLLGLSFVSEKGISGSNQGSFKDRVFDLMEKKGITIKQIVNDNAENISFAWFTKLKKSAVKNPGSDIVCMLADYLGVSSDYLLGLSNVPTTDTDLKSVCDYTGLSVEAIDFIKNTPGIDIELLQRFMSVQQQFGEMLEILNYKK